MIKSLNTLFVTMFGLGKIPKVPGTFGSLATVIILYFFFHILNISSNIILISLIIIFIYSFSAVALHIKDNLEKSNFSINNLDINLICEQPKVSKYRDKIISSISNLMDLNKNLINLKGKTVEKLGLIGKEKAIACEVIVSITKYD